MEIIVAILIIYLVASFIILVGAFGVTTAYGAWRRAAREANVSRQADLGARYLRGDIDLDELDRQEARLALPCDRKWRWCETIYHHGKRYLTRFVLPGGYYLHIFWTGDPDPDPHDHPWDFSTFPFTSYLEMLYDPVKDVWTDNTVEAWQWHHRPAEYIHKVVGPLDRPRPFMTIVKHYRPRRVWGFWERPPAEGAGMARRYVDWKHYDYNKAGSSQGEAS